MIPIHKHDYEFSISLRCMTLDCGRKQEHQSHRKNMQKGFKLESKLLWAVRTAHHSTTLHTAHTLKAHSTRLQKLIWFTKTDIFLEATLADRSRDDRHLLLLLYIWEDLRRSSWKWADRRWGWSGVPCWEALRLTPVVLQHLIIFCSPAGFFFIFKSKTFSSIKIKISQRPQKRTDANLTFFSPLLLLTYAICVSTKICQPGYFPWYSYGCNVVIGSLLITEGTGGQSEKCLCAFSHIYMKKRSVTPINISIWCWATTMSGTLQKSNSDRATCVLEDEMRRLIIPTFISITNGRGDGTQPWGIPEGETPSLDRSPLNLN